MLFEAHAADLESNTGLIDQFMCPICHRLFMFRDLAAGALTIGHIWSRGLRDLAQSSTAAQKVLLCKDCNSQAGSRIDSHAQLREQIREGNESGELSGVRIIEIPRGPTKPSIRLRARVHIDQASEIKGKLVFDLDQRRRQWARNNPEEEAKFRAISASGETFSILINPDRRLAPKLPQAGWIASAYLFSFFTFGYRYILQEQVDKRVRSLIVHALYGDIDLLEFPLESNFAVYEISTVSVSNAELGVVVPAQKDVNVYLRIRFLHNEVRLPFPFVPEVLGSLLFSRIPDFRERLKEVEDDKGFLYVPIRCTKLDGHDCVWDHVLGKPFR
jgi:hypothetical protein